MGEHSNAEQSSSFEKCPQCGGVIVQDHEQQQVICSKCGFVVEDSLKDYGPEWRNYEDDSEDRARGGPPLTEEISDRGKSTTFGSKRDGRGNLLSSQKRQDVSRRRKWDKRFSGENKRSVDRALNRAKLVRSKFGLSKRVSEQVCNLYRRASKEGLVKGRSVDGFVAAAYDIICRQRAISVDIKDLADCLGETESSAKDAKKELISELRLEVPLPSVSRHVRDVLSRVVVFDLDSVRKKANQILAELRDKDVSPSYSSRTPRGIAAAIVYRALDKTGSDLQRSISQREVADQAGVSRTTVQDALDFLDEEVFD